MRGKLLDDMAARNGCYISSLRGPFEQMQCLCRLRATAVETYSLEEWSYSLSYIMGEPLRFESFDAVTAYLEKSTK